MSAKKKPALPDVPKLGESRHNFDARIKELLEVLTGRRGNKVEKLPEGSTLDDVIAKVNEIVDHFM